MLDVTAAITYLHYWFYFHIAVTDSWQCNAIELIECTVMYYLVTLTLSITTINLRMHNLSSIFFFFSFTVIFSHASSRRYCVVQYLIVTSLHVPLQQSLLLFVIPVFYCVIFDRILLLCYYCCFLFPLPMHPLQT